MAPASASRLPGFGSAPPRYRSDRMPPGGLERVERLAERARDFDVSTAGLALAWLRWHPRVTAPIVSPRWSHHWDAVHEALALDLTDAEAAGIAELFD